MPIFVIDKLKQKNNGDFALMDTADINHNGARLDTVVEDLASKVQDYDSFEKFPVTGKPNTVYIDKATDKIYRWDDEGVKYYELANPLTDIKTIDGNF